mmetsp:Transcript_45771/g.132039  ORF Transcript_45771/g.132039 Transcript_45771/m.132039 type:complete len:572 (-) Transcript_45771:318-2033(-)
MFVNCIATSATRGSKCACCCCGCIPGEAPPRRLVRSWPLPMMLGGGVSSPTLLGVIAPRLRSDSVRSEVCEDMPECDGNNTCDIETGSPRNIPATPPMMPDAGPAAALPTGCGNPMGCGNVCECTSDGEDELGADRVDPALSSEPLGLPSSDLPSTTVGTLGQLRRKLKTPRPPLRRLLLLMIALRTVSWLRTAICNSRTSFLSGECSIWASVIWPMTLLRARYTWPPSKSAAPSPHISEMGAMRNRNIIMRCKHGHAWMQRANHFNGWQHSSSKADSAFSPRAHSNSARSWKTSFGAPPAPEKPSPCQPWFLRMRFATSEPLATCFHFVMMSVPGDSCTTEPVTIWLSNSLAVSKWCTSSARASSWTAKIEKTTTAMLIVHQASVNRPQIWARSCFCIEKSAAQKRACSRMPPPFISSSLQSGLQNATIITPKIAEPACTATASTGSSICKAWVSRLTQGYKIMPAVRPIHTTMPSVAISQDAVMVTRPLNTPLQRKPTCKFLWTRKQKMYAPRPPEHAARVVFQAMIPAVIVHADVCAQRVAPELKPYQPTHNVNIPMTCKYVHGRNSP